MTGVTAQHGHLLQYLVKSKHFTKPQPSGSGGTWTELEQLQFLAQVTARPLSELLTEPQRFSQEVTRIQAELSSLAFAEYKSFLRAHASSRLIREELLALHDKLHSLSTSFDDLSVKVDKVLSGTEKYSQERQSVGQIVLKQDQILELLEIPQVHSVHAYFD
jgi:hypothetical protein